MKVCTKCKVEKELNKFSKDKGQVSGYACRCRQCKSDYFKNRGIYLQRIRVSNQPPIVRIKKPIISLEQAKIKHRESVRLFRINNPDKYKNKKAEWYQNNREKSIERAKLWKMNNRDKFDIYTIEYEAKNKEKRNIKNKYYRNKRYKEDSLYRRKENLRKVLAGAFRRLGYKKNKNTTDIFGCEWDFLYMYIQRQFKGGMTWDNRGRKGWHIDHKIPLSSAKNEEDMLAICHYTNLQPLWAIDNIKKSNKILPYQVSLAL